MEHFVAMESDNENFAVTYNYSSNISLNRLRPDLSNCVGDPNASILLVLNDSKGKENVFSLFCVI